jgi:hypothetical protein
MRRLEIQNIDVYYGGDVIRCAGSSASSCRAEIAVAEAMDSELAVVDCGEECSVVG